MAGERGAQWPLGIRTRRGDLFTVGRQDIAMHAHQSTRLANITALTDVVHHGRNLFLRQSRPKEAGKVAPKKIVPFRSEKRDLQVRQRNMRRASFGPQ